MHGGHVLWLCLGFSSVWFVNDKAVTVLIQRIINCFSSKQTTSSGVAAGSLGLGKQTMRISSDRGAT